MKDKDIQSIRLKLNKDFNLNPGEDKINKDELNKSELSKEKTERVSGDELKDDNIINRLNIDKDSLRKGILKKKLKTTRNLQNDRKEDKKNITSDKKDKILFINNLLDYSVKKKIDNKTRERLFNLISKEVDSSSLTKEDVERIVEEKLKEMPPKELMKDEKKRSKEIKISEHKPKDVFNFLSLFRGADHPLKYLIHDFTKPNSMFQLDSFIKDAEKSYRNESRNHYLPKSLKGRLTAFIGINEKYTTWFFKNRPNTFSFNSKGVINWCKNNPGKHPIKKFYNDINWFRESIIIDKNLSKIISFALAETNYHQKLKLEFDENIDNAVLLTDVDAFISGLKCIFNSIGQQAKESINQIKISFGTKRTPENRLRIIQITHIDSICNKELDEKMFGGDLKDAKKWLFQLCDWSIVAQNANYKHNKINILYNPEMNIQPKEKLDDEILGFTHLLTFYS